MAVDVTISDRCTKREEEKLSVAAMSRTAQSGYEVL
ncbi:hypothetical protein C8J36_12022 [Rhizobium sp. PP-F2F-G48]|nr:hypothetical protein C8J36_12022 [Rhizobium sp. PP-F2F-G48]